MSRFRLHTGVAIVLSGLSVACSGQGGSVISPSSAALSSSGSQEAGAYQPFVEIHSEQPPFNLEAVLRGDGFGLVKFRQVRDSTQNIINLDVWVRDLLPNASYNLQRATDTTLDEVCTGTNWLTLGQGLTPQPIVTDDTGTGRAALWRDFSSLAAGPAFDIHFRVIHTPTTTVALASDCHRYVLRD